MFIKRFVSFLICLSLLTFAFPGYVSATEVETPLVEGADSMSFVPMTKEEFAFYDDILRNGTEAEKKDAVDAIFNRNIATYSWEATYKEDMHDGTYQIEGFVKCRHTYNGMVVNTVTGATMRGSGTMGYTWTRCGTSYSSAGSGGYTYDGAPEAYIQSPTKLYVGVKGRFEIAQSVAVSMGINLEVFDSSVEIGGTTYYRLEITDYHIENAPVKG